MSLSYVVDDILTPHGFKDMGSVTTDTFHDLIYVNDNGDRVDIFYDGSQDGFTMSVAKFSGPCRDYYVYEAEEVEWVLRRLYGVKS